MTGGETGPLVSVVLPTRDRAETLGRAIDSVLAQSYAPIELIVVDDGSTDDTAAVLDTYGDAITVLSTDGVGVYPARNLGVRHSRGELIAFLDSDDVWRPDRLAVQVPLLRCRSTALVYGDALLVDRERQTVGRRARTCFQTTTPGRGDIAAHLTLGNCIPTITVLVRRTCLDEAGLFPTSHETSADYAMWLRIALRHGVDYVPDVVADYTVHAGGISADLGSVLSDRIELFTAELSAATDPQVRALLRRLVFTLSLGMVLAVVRGRVGQRRTAVAVARRGMRLATLRDGLRCTALLLLSRGLRACRLAVGVRPVSSCT